MRDSFRSMIGSRKGDGNFPENQRIYSARLADPGRKKPAMARNDVPSGTIWGVQFLSWREDITKKRIGILHPFIYGEMNLSDEELSQKNGM